MKRIVVFSHGFGVAKDSNGLFTDLASSFGSEVASVLFDYNDFEPADRTMTIHPFSVQAKLLNHHLATVRREYPGVPIDLIAHSQGCIVAAIAEPEGLQQAILLAPAENFNLKRLETTFTDRLKPERLSDGTVRLPRRNGSAILIPPAYQPELRLIDPPERYNDLATRTQVTLIRAAQDDILGKYVDDSRLSKAIRIVKLDGDHNFTDPADRQGLITAVKGQLGI